jgi:hypothetical protein
LRAVPEVLEIRQFSEIRVWRRRGKSSLLREKSQAEILFSCHVQFALFAAKWRYACPQRMKIEGFSWTRCSQSSRHSRACGNPGLIFVISLDTRFRGYDGSKWPRSFFSAQRILKRVNEEYEESKTNTFPSELRELPDLRGEILASTYLIAALPRWVLRNLF